MIRVNLLPFREERQKRKIRNQVLGFLLGLMLIISGLFAWMFYMDFSIECLDRETRMVLGEIALYREKAEKVGKIKEQLALLEKKNSIIESLGKSRFCQLELLAELACEIVSGRMWFEHIATDSELVVIRGMALDNKAVADFISRLENSSHYERIDFHKSVVQKTAQGDFLQRFVLKCERSAKCRKVGINGK